jgi:hypothetical protein
VATVYAEWTSDWYGRGGENNSISDRERNRGQSLLWLQLSRLMNMITKYDFFSHENSTYDAVYF